MCAIQNEYSLLHRLFDTDLAEASHNEQVGLLAYSPLSGGLLSNKYKGGAECPAGSRMSINNDMFGRITPRLWDAIAAYKAIADKHGYDMVGMCIAWLQTRPFMGSVIPGAYECGAVAADIGVDEADVKCRGYGGYSGGA